MTTLKKAWNVIFQEPALLLFENEKVVPKKDRVFLLQEIQSRLSRLPDDESGSAKKLKKDQKPLFPNREIWQLTVVPYRIFYELHYSENSINIFFIGRKIKESTDEMYERTLEKLE